jgi:predicted alpha/beta hydrolase family esterase
MKNLIVIHGMPSKEEYFDSSHPSPSKSHWIPWIKEKLEEKGITTDTPEMPEPYAPDYEKWLSVFQQLNLNEETILIGHSCGAGFLVRYLSEHKTQIGKVILVAPWLDPNAQLESKMFSFEIGQNLREKCKDLIMFYSTDDEEDVLASVKILKDKIENLAIREFTEKGHFTYSEMGTVEFPELLEIALS